MTTAESERPIVVGIFRDRALAEQAIDELRHAGFRDDQIRLTGQGATAGGLLETLKSKFSGQGTADGHLYDDLVSLGVPEEEATFYNSEFEAGRTVVTVNTNDRQQDAYDILRRYGAYDFNSRSGQTVGYGSNIDNGTQDQQRVSHSPFSIVKGRDPFRL